MSTSDPSKKNKTQSRSELADLGESLPIPENGGEMLKVERPTPTTREACDYEVPDDQLHATTLFRTATAPLAAQPAGFRGTSRPAPLRDTVPRLTGGVEGHHDVERGVSVITQATIQLRKVASGSFTAVTKAILLMYLLCVDELTG